MVYNEFVINYKNLDLIREQFIKIRSSLSEKELEKALGFETKKDKILSLFSIRYKASKKLINDGVLIYTYIYKSDFYINGNGNFYKSWILFCPDIKYENDPSLYSKIAAKLNYFLKTHPKKYNLLVKKLTNYENDFSLLELPKEVFEEKVFLSTCYTKEKVNPNLSLGVNVCLLNRKSTNKTMILPEYFMSKD